MGVGEVEAGKEGVGVVGVRRLGDKTRAGLM
jgi:hypothetical protein